MLGSTVTRMAWFPVFLFGKVGSCLWTHMTLPFRGKGFYLWQTNMVGKADHIRLHWRAGIEVRVVSDWGAMFVCMGHGSGVKVVGLFALEISCIWGFG